MMADFLSLVSLGLAIYFAYLYRQEEINKAKRRLEADKNRIYDVNKIVKQDIRNEIEKNFKR